MVFVGRIRALRVRVGRIIAVKVKGVGCKIKIEVEG